jgi:ATP-dependent DNA helicase RecQ
VANARDRAQELLEDMLGAGARFNPGQLEAILALAVDHERVLLVQKTGWGKSLVYLLATRLLRDQGHGPTLLISPLLSLMRNQIEMAERIGVSALTINSTNPSEWDRIADELAADHCEILLISPERLANSDFRSKTLPAINKGIGMFVVDEAHCISDWGHDFRPDYRRIAAIVNQLSPDIPVLATTATANDRVIEDINVQLGAGLRVIRGPLARDSLRLQTIGLDDQAERMAWLAEWVPRFEGSGIIYCLTISDCERVSTWLQSKGIDSRPYHGDLESQDREALEQALIHNEVKALVATVALGMGFDKPDLGFVIHFQRPGSVVAYYQQIGRAGRAVESAYAILLTGREDDEITEYFIREAFPAMNLVNDVVRLVKRLGATTKAHLMQELNIPDGKLSQCLKLLEIEGIVLKQHGSLVRTTNPWRLDDEYGRAVTERRIRELDVMKSFATVNSCLMEFIVRELDDPSAAPCGHCASCAGDLVGRNVNDSLVREAIAFLRRSDRLIEPRKRWIGDGVPGHSGNIAAELRAEPGRSLCVWGDAGWGAAVRSGKYEDDRFSDDLVEAAAELIRKRWQPAPMVAWVTAVPSLDRRLVADFAGRLAERLGIPFHEAITKVRRTRPQKAMENSIQQARNIGDAFRVVEEEVDERPALLVDDIVNSGWTLTVCAALLRGAGSGPVFPFTLATTNGARTDW